jgi:glycosyltransferase involved in cell wall biosynthesis
MRMKVLHLTTTDPVCGIANYARTLLDELANLGVDNRVFTIEPQVLKDCHSLASAQGYYQPVVDQARSGGLDVVHIQHEFAFFNGSFDRKDSIRLFGWLLAELSTLPVKVVVTFHSPVPFAGKWWQPNLNWLWHQQVARQFHAKRSPNVVGLLHNHFSLEHYARTGLDRKALRWMPHFPETPSDTPQIHPETVRQIEAALNRQPGDVVIGMVGFINRVKGHFLMVEALKDLPAHYKLLVIGGTSPWGKPKIENRLRSAVKAAGLNDRVHITGLFEEADLPSLLAPVDVFAAPYSKKFRSSSGALYVALQSGKPVVASDCPSFVEINQEQPALAMIPDGNKEALVRTVQRMAENAVERQTRLEAIRRYLQAHSPEKAGRHLFDLYQQLTVSSPR